MKKVEVFTDGACRGNPGPGGYGVILRCNGKEKELSGSEAHTTNNRMELTGPIIALKQLTEPCEVIVCTDSQYLSKGITEWIIQWKLKGWKTAARKPVQNEDLWRQIDALRQSHKVTWKWVKGHAGHVENERCDQLANLAIDSLIG